MNRSQESENPKHSFVRNLRNFRFPGHAERKHFRELVGENERRYFNMSDVDKASFDEEYIEVLDNVKVPLSVRLRQGVRLSTLILSGLVVGSMPFAVERFSNNFLNGITPQDDLKAIGIGFLLSTATAVMQVPRVDRADTIFFEEKRKELLDEYEISH
ncbi:MAG TPA: hypothetical protein VF189_03270 [Patescibacteria group bacterium]